MADTIRVRALTTVYHNSVMYKPGDEFEYDGKLAGTPDEGLEAITAKSTKAFEEAKKAAIQEAVAKAESLRAYHADLVKQSAEKPGQVDLARKVIDADTAASDAEKEAEALKGQNDDLV